jgi:hypothetical protein
MHRRHIDDQAAIVGAETGCAVPPVTNGEVEPVIAGEVHGGDDVSHLLGAEHRQRALVKHAVVNDARLIVALVAGGEQLAPYALTQGRDTDPGGWLPDG